MEANATKVVKPTRLRIRSLFRRSDLSIRTCLVACFVGIVLLMIAADAVAVWQLRQIAAPAQRLNKADQISHAVVRVHLDVDTFRDSVAALASSHDTGQFAGEAAAIRRTFLQHVDLAEQMLTATPDIEQGPTISSALESLRATLLSQLDTAVQLATAGEWNAVRLRLATQIPALIEFSALLVERVDEQVLQLRSKAIEDTQKARQRLFIIVPIAALLTLLGAAALGWYVTRTVTTPLAELTAGAEALARSDFQHNVNLRGDNELAVLGKTFNYAARQLQQLYEGLRRSEGYLAEAQRLAHIAAWVWEVAGRNASYLTDEWYRIYGFDPRDGLPTWEERLQRVHPEDRATWTSAIDRAVADKTDYEVDYRILVPGVGVKHIHAVGHPVFNSAGELLQFVGVSMDVTERKQAEEERERLRQAQSELAHVNRVTTMGELAASIAHEIKQPIAAAHTNAKTCLRWLVRDQPDIEEAREAASRIIQDVTRASEIIGRVRVLFKKGEPQREWVDVNEVIGEMISLLHSEAGRRGISLHTELAPELPHVRADRVQLQQVFMNLMLNGIDAINEANLAGHLTIKSQRNPENQVLISVSDTGIGLPPERTDKVFEAFFTTKPRGTGMGLSISRSIIESHGGRLWATVNADRGATFQFTLPLERAAAA